MPLRQVAADDDVCPECGLPFTQHEMAAAPSGRYARCPDLWGTYLAAVHELELPSGAVTLTPAAEPGEYPAGAAERFVVTAWNPGSRPTRADDNGLAQTRLAADLVRAGAVVHAARGRSPGGSWAEEGFVVSGIGEVEVLALGRAYGQAAVYAWTAAGWSVVACSGGRRSTVGWTLAPTTP